MFHIADHIWPSFSLQYTHLGLKDSGEMFYCLVYFGHITSLELLVWSVQYLIDFSGDVLEGGIDYCHSIFLL